jgi:transposase
MDKAAFLDFTIEIIKRSGTAQGFEVLPRRWVVERTFGWMTGGAGSCETTRSASTGSQAMIRVALGNILLRRIAHQQTFSNGL